MSEITVNAGAPAPERPQRMSAADEPMSHYVSPAPFDPYSVDVMTAEQERFYRASQWRLMWMRFRRHRVAVASGALLLVFYAVILFCEFLSPYALDSRHTDPYKFWGYIAGDLHLICPAEGGTLFLLGTDRLGRDLLSRIVYGARISLTVGLIGVIVSFTLGILIGGIAGYYGGWTDILIQRGIEVIQSFPHLPLWMALSAVLPVTWSPILVYFGITLILGMIEWTHLARAVRSKLLALREEDFCTAAVLMGATPARIIGRHLLPSFMSHLIASATLVIPGMILGETALSFLGLGLRPPITSWGVLLNEAQNISVVALYPWLMLPVLPVILTVLAFNFLGDGLRDAADPYH